MSTVGIRILVILIVFPPIESTLYLPGFTPYNLDRYILFVFCVRCFGGELWMVRACAMSAVLVY